MALKKLVTLLLLLSLLTLSALAVIDMGLRNPVTPQGIVSFEFCGFSGRCADALLVWQEAGRNLAMLSLGLDYLFLLLYPGVMGCALLLLAERLPAPRADGARRAARLVWVMALADALENFMLVQVIRSGDAGSYSEWASIFATVKFLLLLLTLVNLFRFWRAAAAAESAS